VGILDLVAVQLPDFWPAPRLLEETARNIPQRIAFDDHVLVRDIFGQFQLVCPGWGCGQTAKEKKRYNESTHWRSLVAEKYPAIGRRFRATWLTPFWYHPGRLSYLL